MKIQPLILTYAVRWMPHDTAYCIAKSLDRGRFQPLVAVPAEGSMADSLRAEDVPVRVVPGLEPWRGGLQRIAGKAVLRRLEAIARQSGATFIHADRGPVVPWGVMLARRLGLPVIGCIRNRYSDSRAKRYRLPEVDRIVSNNRAALRQKAAFLPVDRSVVIPNGIDLQAFDSREPARNVRADLRISSHVLLVGMVGLRRIKRPDWVVRAAVALRDRFPTAHWMLVGGFKDSSFEAEIRAAVIHHGLQDHFVFPGSRSSMPPFYRAMDVLCHPSLREGAPRAVLEAMAAGVPVVAAGVDGVPELLEDGDSGVIFSVNDFAALQEALGLLLENRALRLRMGAAGRARVESRFTLKKAVAAYEELYESIVR